jgi:hypothetical protein
VTSSLQGNHQPGGAPRRDGGTLLPGAFPIGDRGFLRLFEQDPATGRWKPSPWMPHGGVGGRGDATPPVSVERDGGGRGEGMPRPHRRRWRRT